MELPEMPIDDEITLLPCVAGSDFSESTRQIDEINKRMLAVFAYKEGDLAGDLPSSTYIAAVYKLQEQERRLNEALVATARYMVPRR